MLPVPFWSFLTRVSGSFRRLRFRLHILPKPYVTTRVGPVQAMAQCSAALPSHIPTHSSHNQPIHHCPAPAPTMIPTQQVLSAASAAAKAPKQRDLQPVMTLGKGAAACAGPAKVYGACILAQYEMVEKGMCEAEFREFKNCVQQKVSRGARMMREAQGGWTGGEGADVALPLFFCATLLSRSGASGRFAALPVSCHPYWTELCREPARATLAREVARRGCLAAYMRSLARQSIPLLESPATSTTRSVLSR